MPNDRCHTNQNTRIILRDLVDSTKGDIKVSNLVNELNKRNKRCEFCSNRVGSLLSSLGGLERVGRGVWRKVDD